MVLIMGISITVVHHNMGAEAILNNLNMVLEEDTAPRKLRLSSPVAIKSEPDLLQHIRPTIMRDMPIVKHSVVMWPGMMEGNLELQTIHSSLT